MKPAGDIGLLSALNLAKGFVINAVWTLDADREPHPLSSITFGGSCYWFKNKFWPMSEVRTRFLDKLCASM